MFVYNTNDSRSTKFIQMMINLLTAWSNLCLGCCGDTRRILHDICIYAMAAFTQLSESWPMGFLLSVSFVCVEILRPSQPNGVMSSAVSLSNHTFTGQALSSKRLTSIVHILSPEICIICRYKTEQNRNYPVSRLSQHMINMYWAQ